MGHRPHIFFLNIVKEKDQINENCVYALAIQSNMQTSRYKKIFFHVEDNIKMSTQVYRIHVDDLYEYFYSWLHGLQWTKGLGIMDDIS